MRDLDKISADGLLSDDLAPLLWHPERLDKPSAWVGHIPFAHWLVCAARPRLIVELGTHNGVSYSAFCAAVKRTGSSSRCFAVDTWQGDAHAGHYAEDIFNELKRFHDEHYCGFSTMLRMTFDEAVGRFDDASIDILHIDGLHTYDAVRHDFETWLPKLSDRAVVLFHDTAEHREDFGVWHLWEDIRGHYPSFEFLHSYGLGVLCVGRAAPEPVLRLCATTAPEDVAKIRERFQFAGERWIAEARVMQLEAQIANIGTYVPLRKIASVRRTIRGLLESYYKQGPR